MYKHYPKPAIIGSGLTGLLISLALSKARVQHVLIGGPPPTNRPRLGESLNLGATIYFLAEFPELISCYYAKQFAKIITDTVVGGFDFSIQKNSTLKYHYNFWGKQALDGLIHVDRICLDAALYEKAVNHPYCIHLNTRVSQLICRPDSDHIQQIIVEDGTSLPVSHVFDATGPVRLVARQLGIPRQLFGSPQQTVYAHYHQRPDAPQSHVGAAWRHETTILRLYKERVGIDGMAWCIPLGNIVSIGVSTQQADPGLSRELLLQITGEEFSHHGVDYLNQVNDDPSIAQARMEFYIHNRASGANWLLAGAAHSQIWWMSSIGLDMAVAAARAAVPFVHRPASIRASYQHYLDPLPRLHDFWDRAITHPYGWVTIQRMQQYEREVSRFTQSRFFRELMLEKQDSLLPIAASLIFQGLNRIGYHLPIPGLAHRAQVSD